MPALLSSTQTDLRVVNLLTAGDDFTEAWDQFVSRHPKGSIFHLSPMVRALQAAKGHTVLPLAAVDGSGEIVALLVAVRVQTLPDPFGRLASRSIFYAEPLCHDDEFCIDALTALISLHDREMRNRVLFTEIRPLCAVGPERIALERCGYEFLDYLNYLIDLTQPAEVLWSKLSKSGARGSVNANNVDFRSAKSTPPKELTSSTDYSR